MIQITFAIQIFLAVQIFFRRPNLFFDVQNFLFRRPKYFSQPKNFGRPKKFGWLKPDFADQKKNWTAKNILDGQKIFGRPKKIWTDRWHRHRYVLNFFPIVFEGT